MISLLVLAAVTPALPIETQAQRFVVEQFERVGRANPALDAALSKAARLAAQQALDGTVSEAIDASYLTALVSEAGATDPTPRAFVIRGSPRSEIMKSLSGRKDLAQDGATHIGIGAVEDAAEDRGALVVLLANRRAELQPFPHHFPKKGATKKLCATLSSLLSSGEIFVTAPTGVVDRLATAREQDRWCAQLTFPLKGRYTVELLARGERGPEVAALFFVDVGPKPVLARPELVQAEPQTPLETRAAVLSRINQLRAGHQLPALTADPALDAIAAAYAKRMVDEGFFSHFAPEGTNLTQRLQAAKYEATTAGENLGLASGPLAAHFGIEHSPGHRKNLMEPIYTVAGIGTAANETGQLILVEVLAKPLEKFSGANPLETAYDALAQARKAKGLKPLTRAGAFERVLEDHARRALELNTPKATLEGKSVNERLLELREDLSSGAVDFFIADNPAQIATSKNLPNPEASLVAIGMTRGDSPTFGRDKYWVVVFYGTLR